MYFIVLPGHQYFWSRGTCHITLYILMTINLYFDKVQYHIFNSLFWFSTSLGLQVRKLEVDKYNAPVHPTEEWTSDNQSFYWYITPSFSNITSQNNPDGTDADLFHYSHSSQSIKHGLGVDLLFNFLPKLNLPEVFICRRWSVDIDIRHS